MKESVKKRIFARDGGVCWHCGTTEDLTIHHRANRGMGGSKLLDRASNLILMCVIHNGLMESDVNIFREAKQNGWKISRHSIPYNIPIRDSLGRWYKLGDMYEKWEIDGD